MRKFIKWWCLSSGGAEIFEMLSLPLLYPYGLMSTIASVLTINNLKIKC